MRVDTLALVQRERRSVMILQEVDKALVGNLVFVESEMSIITVKVPRRTAPTWPEVWSPPPSTSWHCPAALRTHSALPRRRQLAR